MRGPIKMETIKLPEKSPEWDTALTGRIKGTEDPEDLNYPRQSRLSTFLTDASLWLAIGVLAGLVWSRVN